jgi:ribonuclease HI
VNQINVYFDGGTGKSSVKGVFGYGSWEVHFNGFVKRVERDPFAKNRVGYDITNNVFEYLALIGALEFLQTVQNKHLYEIKISGDSQLVIRQLTGGYRCKKSHLKKLRGHAIMLLTNFKWTVEWKPRVHSVRRFGH